MTQQSAIIAIKSKKVFMILNFGRGWQRECRQKEYLIINWLSIK